jgi:hypothetical protein
VDEDDDVAIPASKTRRKRTAETADRKIDNDQDNEAVDEDVQDAGIVDVMIDDRGMEVDGRQGVEGENMAGGSGQRHDEAEETEETEKTQEGEEEQEKSIGEEEGIGPKGDKDEEDEEDEEESEESDESEDKEEEGKGKGKRAETSEEEADARMMKEKEITAADDQEMVVDEDITRAKEKGKGKGKQREDQREDQRPVPKPLKVRQPTQPRGRGAAVGVETADRHVAVVDDVEAKAKAGRNTSKKRATGTSKKTNATSSTSMVIDDDDDFEGTLPAEERTQGSTLVGTDSAPDECVRCLISINRVDILEPPLPWRFGVYNNRARIDKVTGTLAKDMKARKLRPYLDATVLMLIISAEHVDPSCLNPTQIGISDAPFLKLSAKGREELTHLVLAGGRHRHAAMMIIRDEHTSVIQKLEEEIKAIGVIGNKKALTSKKQGELQEATEKLKDTKEHLKTLGHWGVYVYDSRTYFTALYAGII